MNIAVIGAGIGGLTTAALLIEQGHDVTVFEKKTQITELAAGIGIGDNVIQKLAGHDLAKGILNHGQEMEGMFIRSAEGHKLTKMMFRKKTMNVTLLRQTLVDLIASYVPETAIRFATKVQRVENTADGVTVYPEADSTAFDLCIGADGIHSNVRQTVAPKSKVLYQGYTCFRGVVDDVNLKYDNFAYEYWGKAGRFGIVPMLDGRVYWFATINAKEHDAKYQNFAKPHLQAYFNHFPAYVRQVLDQQDESTILHHDIYDLKPLSTFVYGHTILLGDAAHATTPNMGQGAGQAMEDAIVLAQCLAHYPVEKALARYDRLRVKHTKKVIKKSRSIGKKAQYQNGLKVRVRNTVLKRVPKWMINRQNKFIFKSKVK